MNTKPIGCICHLDKVVGKCVICSRIDKPGYESVKVNLSSSRILPNNKHLAPISLPMPKEVVELRSSKSPRSLNIVKSPFKCTYGGEETGNLVTCPSCGGNNTKLKIFECGIHTSCTVDREVPGIQCCLRCNDFTEKK